MKTLVRSCTSCGVPEAEVKPFEMKMMMQGDTHGNTVAIRRALRYAQVEGCDELFVVGDFGFGWSRSSTGDAFVESVSRAAISYDIDVYWLDGNHENFDLLEGYGYFKHDGPVEICERVFYVPRGTVLKRGVHNILVIGGAYSVDKAYRTEGHSWWPQEEITYEDLEKCADACAEAGTIDVVFSHDAPNSAFVAAMSIAVDGDLAEMQHLVWKNDQQFPGACPNRASLELILQATKPTLWVHGHYHSAYDVDLNGTRVLALDMETEKGALAVLDFGLPTVDFDRVGE